MYGRGVSSEVETAQPRSSRLDRPAPLWLVLAVLAVLGFGAWYVVTGAARQARDACTQEIRGKIANPAGAQFVFNPDEQLDSGQTQLSGYADSVRRHSFRCVMNGATVVSSEAD